tara:strand:- start:1047 stop:1508 length:462 start_codon:yes stop_codon:yes gene_type:complete
MKSIILKNDEATCRLGKLIANEILKITKPTIEIHLDGDLGAGKTFLTRSIISNSGWNGLVKSPTYTLCEEYDLEDFIFLHIDLYRTNEPEDIHIFDIDRKTHPKKIIIIEWPQKLIEKRKFDLKVSFEHLESGRRIFINDKSQLFSDLTKHYE